MRCTLSNDLWYQCRTTQIMFVKFRQSSPRFVSRYLYYTTLRLYRSNTSWMFNPYPANTESGESLPPVWSQTSLHIRAVWPGPILLADQLQVFILISLKMTMESAKNVKWIIPFKKFSMIRVKLYLSQGSGLVTAVPGSMPETGSNNNSILTVSSTCSYY